MGRTAAQDAKVQHAKRRDAKAEVAKAEAAKGDSAKSRADERPEDRVRRRASELGQALAGRVRAADLKSARALLIELRNLRAHEALAALAERLLRIDPADAPSSRLYAQSLIETGQVVPAIAMLRQLLATLPRGHDEIAEAWGLLGRAHKQLFFDAGDLSTAGARQALKEAVAAYLKPYKADPQRNTWHGVNVLALLTRARREGWTEIAPREQPLKLARALVATLDAVPKKQRDEWYLPTLAEARLGLALADGDLGPVLALLRQYVGAPDVPAFLVASTLRQFSQVWALEALRLGQPGLGLQTEHAVQQARALVTILRARLLQLPGGSLELEARAARSRPEPPASSGMRGQRGRSRDLLQSQDPAEPPTPDNSQLEAVLGADGPRTMRWYAAGLAAARSVAAVKQKLGGRIGTGFLVRAGEFGLSPADEPLLLTNFHVINPDGAAPGIPPQRAEIAFEADDAAKVYTVAQLLWCSPVDQHDAALLRLSPTPAGVPTLSLCTQLPALPAPDAKKKPRVYVIGHPGGRELSISFDDSQLLDHEGPPTGKPPIAGVVRVHYFTPTEGGNSGSPVFEDQGWEVIALHHKGGKFGMPRLNGQAGNYAANEGLAIGALLAAARKALAPAG